MPKLRFEPKIKPPVSDEEYKQYKEILSQGQENSKENNVFMDLEESDNPAYIRRAVLYVAEKEGISVKATHRRKDNSFMLAFSATGTSGVRKSAEEARDLILGTLKEAGDYLKRSDILKKTGITAASWNVRIRELVKAGLVRRQGKGRETSYTVKLD